MLRKLLPSIAIVGLAACVLAAGCHRRTQQDFVPSAATARQAVVQAMDAWQSGQPPGLIEGQPAIQVADNHRRSGQKLAAYEIVGELPSDEGRRFAVRVKLTDPAAEEKINYLVVGIDPLWVFRQEDYDMVIHWEHNMPAAAAQPQQESTKSEAPIPNEIPSTNAQ